MSTLWEILRKHGLPLDKAQWICNEAMLSGITKEPGHPVDPERALMDSIQAEGFPYDAARNLADLIKRAGLRLEFAAPEPPGGEDV